VSGFLFKSSEDKISFKLRGIDAIKKQAFGEKEFGCLISITPLTS
jgi:hypothetical protein